MLFNDYDVYYINKKNKAVSVVVQKPHTKDHEGVGYKSRLLKRS